MSTTTTPRTDETTEATRVERRTETRVGTWQRVRDRIAPTLVGGGLGVLILVIALVTLARTGIPADDLTAATATVGPFTRTALMGILEVVFGLLLISAGTADGNGLSGLGLVAGVLGIVWLIEPGAFQGALGVTRATAWLYLVVGGASLTAGLLSGPVVRREIRVG